MRATRRRRSDHGQVLPLVALAAVVLFAFAALALDGAFAFNARRGDQSMADFAALAGAMQLTQPVPDATQQTAARQKAVEYLQRATGTYQAGNDPCASAYGSDIDPVNNPCSVAGFSVWVTTPLPAPVNGYDPNHLVQVRLQHPVEGRLLSAAGMSRFLSIGASAVAVNPGTGPLPIHVVWATERPNGSNGGGNTLQVYGSTTNATAQVDDGANGTDCPQPQGSTPASGIDVYSAEKIHAEGNNGSLNVNGVIDLTKFDHDQNTNDNVLSWWGSAQPERGVPADLDPHFAPPTDNPAAYVSSPSSLVTVSADKATVTFHPGHYTLPLVVQPAGSYGSGNQKVTWTASATTFVFANGVYWFDSSGGGGGGGGSGANKPGVTFAASATYQAYSQDYNPATNSFGSRTGTTDGVEFYMTGQAVFAAFGGTVNLQAPTIIDPSMRRPITGTTAAIGVFVDRGDTGDTNSNGSNGTQTRPPGTPGFVNTPVAIGTLSGFPTGATFSMHGVVYVQNDQTGSVGSGVLVTPSSTDYHKYAVQGAVVAPYVVLNTGTVSMAPTGMPPFPYCVDDTQASPPLRAARLVQYDPALADILRTTVGADTVLLQ